METLESNALFVSNKNISLAREIKILSNRRAVNVINCENISKLLSEFVKIKPHILFFDFIKPIDGARTIISNFLSDGFYEISKIILIVNDETKDSFEDLMQLNSAKEKIIIVHEYEIDTTQNILNNVLFSVIESRNRQHSFVDVDREIINLLSFVRINKKHKGYKMLKDAVRMVCLNDGIVECLFKIIYPAVAANNNTSSFCVERNIRSALRYIHTSTPKENLKKTFGESIDVNKKITNLEAITMLSENVLCSLRNM